MIRVFTVRPPKLNHPLTGLNVVKIDILSCHSKSSCKTFRNFPFRGTGQRLSPGLSLQFMSVSPLPLHWRFFAALPVGFFRARSGLRLDNGKISIHLWKIGKANHLHVSAVIQACGGNLLLRKHVTPTASCEYA